MRSSLAGTSVVMALALCLMLVAGPVQAADQIVVDRSTVDKTINEYVLHTRDAVQSVWTTPVPVAGASAVKARITVNYVVSRSGELESVSLVRGSGNDEFDKSLVDAIRSAAPFAPFPEGVHAGSMLVRAKFIVAEVPTVGVTTVDMKVSNDTAQPTPPVSAEPEEPKFVWGSPAEKSSAAPAQPDAAMPPAPAPPRYRWGLER